MVEIVDEDGTINYDQAFDDLKTFLYGRKGKIDTHLHFQDLLFYLQPRNLLFTLRSFSFTIVPKILGLWNDMGRKNLQRYFDLNVLAVLNKLKEREKNRGLGDE